MKACPVRPTPSSRRRRTIEEATLMGGVFHSIFFGLVLVQFQNSLLRSRVFFDMCFQIAAHGHTRCSSPSLFASQRAQRVWQSAMEGDNHRCRDDQVPQGPRVSKLAPLRRLTALQQCAAVTRLITYPPLGRDPAGDGMLPGICEAAKDLSSGRCVLFAASGASCRTTV